jgi:hypothetical protein
MYRNHSQSVKKKHQLDPKFVKIFENRKKNEETEICDPRKIVSELEDDDERSDSDSDAEEDLNGDDDEVEYNFFSESSQSESEYVLEEVSLNDFQEQNESAPSVESENDENCEPESENVITEELEPTETVPEANKTTEQEVQPIQSSQKSPKKRTRRANFKNKQKVPAFNISTVCRLCLSKDSSLELLSIFEENRSEILGKVTGVDVSYRMKLFQIFLC